MPLVLAEKIIFTRASRFLTDRRPRGVYLSTRQMNSPLNRWTRLCAVVAVLVTSQDCLSNPIDVSYTASGTSGNYLLNFTVVNNMTSNPTQDIYLFGVRLDNSSVQGSPTGFDSSFYTTWNNQTNGYGGSNTDYNAVWVDFSKSHFPGSSSPTSLSGFTVKVTGLNLPTTVNWFAYSISSTSSPYTGDGNFYAGSPNNSNVGFEGTFVHPSNVPEPSTFALLSLSGIACGVWNLRRRLTQA